MCIRKDILSLLCQNVIPENQTKVRGEKKLRTRSKPQMDKTLLSD